MNKTKIEYLDYTWNPFAMRCTPISFGCLNCWHLTMADRLAGNPKIPRVRREAYAGERAPVLIGQRMPKKPGVIGVQFMGDLFHPDIPAELIGHVLDRIQAHREHRFVLLTKRPRRMVELVNYWGGNASNLWLGVTAENQPSIDDRVPILVSLPRKDVNLWVSLEPMLDVVALPNYALRRLDWVVVGCESGPGRRPMPEMGLVHIVEQCQHWDVPLFIKQIEVDGRVSHDPAEWPPEYRIQQNPTKGALQWT